MQTPQFQEPAGSLNRSPNPAELEGAVATAGGGWGEGSGLGERRATGEEKPGALRRSRTLPCFNTLAGLKGPSNSSGSSLAGDFTADRMGVSELPLDTERAVLATGALKVKPAEGEKEGGLAAVAMTMGEEKVKGAQGGEDAMGDSLLLTSSPATGLIGATVGVTVGVTVAVGGGAEKLNVGRLKELMGKEMAGRSSTSATSSSGRLEEGRVLVLSLFILPPPEPGLLAVAGVLDRG